MHEFWSEIEQKISFTGLTVTKTAPQFHFQLGSPELILEINEESKLALFVTYFSDSLVIVIRPSLMRYNVSIDKVNCNVGHNDGEPVDTRY